jgi:hypothetical protein
MKAVCLIAIIANETKKGKQILPCGVETESVFIQNLFKSIVSPDKKGDRAGYGERAAGDRPGFQEIRSDAAGCEQSEHRRIVGRALDFSA